MVRVKRQLEARARRQRSERAVLGQAWRAWSGLVLHKKMARTWLRQQQAAIASAGSMRAVLAYNDEEDEDDDEEQLQSN